MKRLLPRLTPASRIAIGLISLVVTLLLLIDLTLNLVPDQTDIQRKVRASISERIAMQVTMLIQAQEWEALKVTVHQTLVRDKEIRSLAVRREDGRILVQAGNHAKEWVSPASGTSTLTHVRVPLFSGGALWGDVEISYQPVTPQTLGDWLRVPLVTLALIIVPVGLLAFYLYMRRTLQYLDPSAAIPDRVRAAFDALTEGVAVIDKAGRIMLYNKAFRQLQPLVDHNYIGKNFSQLPWLVANNPAALAPWDFALQNETSADEQPYSVPQPGDTTTDIIVKAAPIQDIRGRLRGCMVTFYDVSEIHRTNEIMRSTLAELEASRAQIEKKNEELTRLASRDSLTGCLNRRAFFAAAQDLFDSTKHEARDLACIMVDVDFFKRVNDNFGHQIGDQVIMAVASSLSLNIRDADLLCRYGGEEFCIVMPGASEDIAAALAERLRQEIQQQVGSSIHTVENLQVTSSFGVASLKSGAESLVELIECADFALYTAKQNGRNRVTVWDSSLQRGPQNSTPISSARKART